METFLQSLIYDCSMTLRNRRGTEVPDVGFIPLLLLGSQFRRCDSYGRSGWSSFTWTKESPVTEPPNLRGIIIYPSWKSCITIKGSVKYQWLNSLTSSIGRLLHRSFMRTLLLNIYNSSHLISEYILRLWGKQWLMNVVDSMCRYESAGGFMRTTVAVMVRVEEEGVHVKTVQYVEYLSTTFHSHKG